MSRRPPLLVDWRLGAVRGEGIGHHLDDPARVVEQRILSHLADVAPELLVPRPLGTMTVGGGSYAVYTRCGDADLQELLPVGADSPPRPLGYDREPPADSAPVREPLSALAHELATLHAATPPKPDDDPLADTPPFRLLRSPGELRRYTTHELDRAVQRAATAGFVTDAHRTALDRVRAELATAALGAPGLVHFDLHPRNVRVATAEGQPRLAGIIDFKNTHYWLTEFDIVSMCWHLAPLPSNVADRFFARYEAVRGAPLDWSLVTLCEVIRLAFVLANGERRERPWVEWCRRRWDVALRNF